MSLKIALTEPELGDGLKFAPQANVRPRYAILTRDNLS